MKIRESQMNMAKGQISHKPAMSRLLSIPVMALAILLVYGLRIPNPMMILIIPVVYFTYAYGYIGGMLSGALAVAYSLFFFSEADDLIADSRENMTKVLTIVLAVTVIITLVGRLKNSDAKSTLRTQRISEDFLHVLSGIDLQLLVTDPNDDTVLFVNEKINIGHGVEYNPLGKPCWQVYQQRESRCEDCPIDRVGDTPDVPVFWEYHNERTDRWYLNRDSMIPWTDGRMVHLQQRMDVTDSHRVQESLRDRLRQQELMSAMSRSFISDQDTKALIENALRATGEFLEADRVTLRCYEEGCRSARFMATWCGPASMEPSVPARGPMTALYEIFAREDKPYFHCMDVANHPQFAAMEANGIASFIAVPVTVDGALWGVLCLEMCSRLRVARRGDFDIGQMVGNLISGVLLRERTQDKLRDALERAEQSARAKANFLANMSHEIRTPMNAIIGMTELARISTDPRRVPYYLEKMDDASHHLLGVINDILDMSKIDEGRMELCSVDFPLEKMLRQVSTITAFRAEQKKQEFLIWVDPDVPEAIVADQQRLAQVLANLLSNAVKFTPDGGRVQLTVSSLGEENGLCSLLFEVEDNGIGISPENQTLIFQPFQQGDNAISRRYGGTGLGLSICTSIVSLMGGELHVQSRLGEGSRFWFIIQVSAGESPPISRLGEETDWSWVRVLLVDDDPDVRKYVTNVATKAGLSCTAAAGAEEALALLESRPSFQLMLVDWRMPEMDGIELTRLVREKYGRQMGVVLISAPESEAVEAEAHAAGVDEILARPLLPSLIIDCLNRCLAVSQTPRRGEYGGRDFDPDGGRNGIFDGKRVLVAEDVEINWEIVAAILSETGLQLENACNGRQAVELVQADPGRYALILMDIHMPQMDGYEAAQTIRGLEDERARSIPIIAMTANVFKEDVDRCLKSGMNDHIGKPIDSRELVSKLGHFLGHASNTRVSATPN